ncbi:MAG TPA: hypothetical protein V6C96_00370 [Vampirovibrionales bacterium]
MVGLSVNNLPGLNIASQLSSRALSWAAGGVNNIYGSQPQKNNVARRIIADRFANMFPIPNAKDKELNQVVNGHPGAESAKEAIRFLVEHKYPFKSLFGDQEKLYQRMWTDLSSFDWNQNNAFEQFKTQFKVESLTNQNFEEIKASIFQTKGTETVFGPIQPNLLGQIAKREKWTGIRQIGSFFVGPLFAQGLFGFVGTALQAGLKGPAQLAAILGSWFASLPSLTVAQSVTKHHDYSVLKSQGGVAGKFVPIMILGTILSHTLSPLLSTLGFAVNFDGEIGGKDNSIGRVIKFFRNAFDLFGSFSLLGFAFGPMDILANFDERTNSQMATWAGKDGRGLIDGREKSWFKGVMKFGKWANLGGFFPSLISDFVSILLIKPQREKVEKKYQAIIEELSQKQDDLQKVLILKIRNGEITEEQAIAQFKKMNDKYNEFLQNILLPQYEDEIGKYKTATWITDCVKWASWIGVTFQMFSQKYVNTIMLAKQKQDKFAKEKGLGASGPSGLKFGEALKMTIKGQHTGRFPLALTYAGFLVAPLAIGISLLSEGVGALLSEDSPLVRGKDKSPIVEMVEKFRENPITNIALTAAMFAG